MTLVLSSKTRLIAIFARLRIAPTAYHGSVARDKTLILEILRYVEAKATIRRPLAPPSFADYSRWQVRHHIELCEQASFLQLQNKGDPHRIRTLTWKGMSTWTRAVTDWRAS